MALSRLRLRLTALFGSAFLLGLVLLDLALFHHVTHQADRRLTLSLQAEASGLLQAIQREQQDPAGRPLQDAVADALDEWPPGAASLLVLSPDGDSLDALGDPRLITAALESRSLNPGSAIRSFPLAGKGEGRAAVTRDGTIPSLVVAAMQSTADLREERESLAGWLLATAPLVLLFSLAAGYALARLALGPIRRMADAMAGMSPGRLDRRLQVHQPPDELDGLAEQFNHLLDRLERARRRNRSFLAQAAHQLRTPLTLVRGESEFGLGRPRSAPEYRTILERIRAAAGYMSQRVNDLFLLAEADAEDAPPLEDRVELDGLLLECLDLMRERARATAHRLQFGRVEPAEFTGNERLLREAVMELVENACRHADDGSAIILDGYPDDQVIRIEVLSRGARLPDDVPADPPNDGGNAEGGLGLSIVKWIARVHGGTLEYLHQDRTNRFAIMLPRQSPLEPDVPEDTR